MVLLAIYPAPGGTTDLMIHLDRLRSMLSQENAQRIAYKVEDGGFKQVSDDKPVSLVTVTSSFSEDGCAGKIAVAVGNFWLPFANVMVTFSDGRSRSLPMGSGGNGLQF